MRPSAAATLSGAQASLAPRLHRLLARLIIADARYREARRLEELPEERLRDVGLTRADLTQR